MARITRIKTNDCLFSGSEIHDNREFSAIWTIGNRDILKAPLTGIFCSIHCPGNVILQIYDLIRALRDAHIPIIGGFQSPMEKECLDLLLRGQQPVVVCPARSIETMRIPAAWHPALDENRLLVLSPFETKHRRPTARLAEQRNRFAAALAARIIVPHASRTGALIALCADWIASGRTILTLDLPENAHLITLGATATTIDDLLK